MADVVAIMAKLDGDAAGMVSAMDKGEKAMGDMAKKGDKSAKDVEGSFSKMEGGVGKIVGKLGGLLAGAFAGAAVVSWGKDTFEALANVDAINKQTESAIQATGGAAGVSSKHVEDLANSLELVTATEAESIQTGANLLLTFKNIKNGAGEGNDIFDQTTKIMTDMGRAMGTDAAGSAVQLGKALNDPVKGISALSKVGVTFTDDQKKMIESMVAAGDVAGAQKIILAELNSEFGGSGAAYATSYAGRIDALKNAFGAASESLLGGFMPVLGSLAGVATKAFLWLSEAPAVAGFGQTIVDAFSTAWSVVGPFVSALATSLAPAFGALLPAVLPLVTALSPLQVVLAALTPVLPQIAQLAQLLADTLSGALTAILPTVVSLVSTLATTLTGVLGAALPVVTVLIEAVANILTQLMPTISLVAGTLGGVLTVVLTQVADALVMLLPFVAQLITQLLPLVAPILGVVAALMPLIGLVAVLAGQMFPILISAAQALLPPILQIVTALVGALIPVFEALMPVISVVIEILAQLIMSLTPLLGPIVSLIAAFAPLIASVLPLLAQLLVPIIQLMAALLTPILGLIQPLIGMLVPAITAVTNVIVTVISWVVQFIANFLTMQGMVNTISKAVGASFSWLYNNAIRPAIDGISGAVRGVQGFISGAFDGIIGAARSVGSAFSDVFGRLGGIISGAFSGAVGVARGAMNGLIGLVNGAIGALNNLKVTIPDFVPGIGGQSFGVSLPRIPMLAKGGTALSDGLAIVGERGPELVTLPKGASVTPSHPSREALADMGRQGTTITNNVYVDNMDEQAMAQFMAQLMEWQLKAAGADV